MTIHIYTADAMITLTRVDGTGNYLRSERIGQCYQVRIIRRRTAAHFLAESRRAGATIRLERRANAAL